MICIMSMLVDYFVDLEVLRSSSMAIALVTLSLRHAENFTAPDDGGGKELMSEQDWGQCLDS